MATIYRKIDCRICGKKVFTVVPYSVNGEVLTADIVIELTCSSGHTDAYDLTESDVRPPSRLTDDHRSNTAALAAIG
jgi:hypothetical protein